MKVYESRHTKPKKGTREGDLFFRVLLPLGFISVRYFCNFADKTD
ncbi:hypothetical protein HMPREF3226_02449 [Prevotella corporis]|uniref:Uncharacterized protein n=1 Tax=Prevotella corporis TaxID=28128 RepID=A0A133PVK5_9BACT|nr:hypothetical protein HMPREF3226_02449 [Prevotella corporis]